MSLSKLLLTLPPINYSFVASPMTPSGIDWWGTDGGSGGNFFWVDHDQRNRTEEISKINGHAIVRVVDAVECITY